jgi:hypothetical protein
MKKWIWSFLIANAIMGIIIGVAICAVKYPIITILVILMLILTILVKHLLGEI